MGRIDAEELPDPERVFVAWSLRAARRVEELLTENAVDYVVEVESLGRSFLFGSDRRAAVFYVTSSRATDCRSRLTGAGLGRGVVGESPGASA